MGDLPNQVQSLDRIALSAQDTSVGVAVSA
jgi:hypothetical protein